MGTETAGRLLVPVANVETVDRLLDTVIDVAHDRSYRIDVVHVVEVPPQIPLTEGDAILGDEEAELLAYAADRVADADVPVETRTRFARDVATGIVSAADDHESVRAMLLGWRGRPPRSGVVLGSYIDHVLKAAPCDVLVQRIRNDGIQTRSLLVPIGRGPHAVYAAGIAGSIARQRGVPVHLVHVVAPDATGDERATAESIFERARGAIGDGPDVDAELVESDHPSGAITDRTSTDSLTVMGTTERGAIRRSLLGSISEDVGRNAAGSVVLAHRALDGER